MPKIDLQTLNDPSRTIELREPRTVGFWLSFGSAIFVIIGGFMILEADGVDVLAGWICSGFFGLGLIVGLMKLFGPIDTLELDESGFTLSNLGQKKKMKWSSIERFGVSGSRSWLPGSAVVVMNLVGVHNNTLTTMARLASGFDGALPSNYGAKPKVLAAAMQARLDASRAV